MSVEFLAGVLLGGGVAALVAFNAGVREGLERASKMWRDR